MFVKTKITVTVTSEIKMDKGRFLKIHTVLITNVTGNPFQSHSIALNFQYLIKKYAFFPENSETIFSKNTLTTLGIRQNTDENQSFVIVTNLHRFGF